MSYVGTGRPTGCIFCVKPAENDDEKNLILFRSERAYVLMNLYPYNSGHVMVVPRRHLADLAQLDGEERLAIMNLLVDTLEVLKLEMTPDGANLGVNLGQAGGAGVPDHLHIHCVPRWNGDTNFMPVTGEAMVLPEALGTTRERLHRRFAEVRPGAAPVAG